MKNYRLIEHTADFGIKVEGKTQKDLFKNASSAMFDIISRKKEKAPTIKKEEIKIILEADGLEELFISWLNELLSLSAAKKLIFFDFKIARLTKNKLEAIVWGETTENYNLNMEIKAATYHELEIKKEAATWQARVIFDV